MRQTELLDHLVGDGEQPIRNIDAERLRGFEVDGELELGGLHDRQVGGLLALKNPASVNAGLPNHIKNIRSVAAQTAGGGKCPKGPNCRNRMAQGKRGKRGKHSGLAG